MALSIDLYGLYLLGALGRAAKRAASSKLSSPTALSKYSKLAAAIPYVPSPKYIWFKYSYIIRSFEYALSILKAKIASLIFLFIETSLVSRKFFATCCVIVDAPSNLFSE